MRKRYEVVLTPQGLFAKTLYCGSSESNMYGIVTAIEWTLIATHGTAEIDIIENGEPRGIEYRDGRRVDIPVNEEDYEW